VDFSEALSQLHRQWQPCGKCGGNSSQTSSINLSLEWRASRRKYLELSAAGNTKQISQRQKNRVLEQKTGGAEKLMKQNEELKARIMKVSPRNYASRDFNILFKLFRQKTEVLKLFLQKLFGS